MQEVGAFMFLGINAWSDIRRKEICLWTIPLFLAGEAGWLILGEGQSLWIFLGVIPGVVLLLFSILSEEALGRGDGLVAMVLGIYTGALEAVLTISLAFLAAGIYSGILWICKYKKNTDSIAFVPFLLIGYIGRCILCL